MDGDAHDRREVGGQRAAVVDGHADARPEQRLRRDGAEADEDLGADEPQLGVQPRAAGLDVAAVGTAAPGPPRGSASVGPVPGAPRRCQPPVT